MVSLATLEEPPVVDCRGMLCPAPILRLAEVARRHRGTGATLTVLANDTDFPVDLEAWCRTTKSSLVRLEHESDGVIRAVVRLAGTIISARPGRAEPAPAPLSATATPLSGTPIRAEVVSATSATVRQERRSVSEPPLSGRPTIRLRSAPVRGAAGAPAEEPSTRDFDDPPSHVYDSRAPATGKAAQRAAILPLPAPATGAAPRENRVTLLIMRNDLEVLLAALMVANASAAQGMSVEIYFSFWGIHLLRGERPRPGGPAERPGLLQRMLLWMVPRGPSRQKLGKLHMGGLGTRILLRLMRKRSILALDQLMEAATTQGVRFRVCSMSMGLMGLTQRDIVDLPNIDFAGVTSFAEMAGRSSVSLVF